MSDALLRRVPWPLPALLGWAAAWGAFLAAGGWLKLPPAAALLLASGVGIVASAAAHTPWRRLIIAGGFPLSAGLSAGVADASPWAWLLPLLLLAAVYPLRTWRDAPLFPTPAGALRGLHAAAPLPAHAQVLDAGCGLGDALIELRREYPQAQFTGLEWSWPLRLACAWRARFAVVRRADIWAADWSDYDLVYVFQRPDNMARAGAKADRELRPGNWLASLEFAAPGLQPTRTFETAGGRRVWLYQAPFVRSP